MYVEKLHKINMENSVKIAVSLLLMRNSQTSLPSKMNLVKRRTKFIRVEYVGMNSIAVDVKASSIINPGMTAYVGDAENE